MSDKFYRISIERLFTWITEEEKHGRFFGLYKENLFTPKKTDPYKLRRYGQLLETPLGVAAGPHTQMAQNIISSWLVGARYIELKTVQTLDELEVIKPCIDMEDEGYNCEWSQELKIKDSYDEYLNAWILIHLLKHKFGWDDTKSGFIFNLSVGYNLEGILKPNVQWFIDKMNNCKTEKDEKIAILSKYYPDIDKINIPDQISNNITLSTMHGCPANEIESIGKYLIEERKLHTTIKLNPTLLGSERLRFILNEKLGYEITVPDEAFEHDLKYDDAIKMINSLQSCAKENNVEFGLKLTNTLESLNSTNWLPKEENMVYTSGRALHPISINLAEKLQSDFNGELDISFSAGVDAFNVSDTLACNLKPITVCSDLLKPGGYLRMIQYFEELDINFLKLGVNSIDDFIKIIAKKDNTTKAGLSNLRKYSLSIFGVKLGTNFVLNAGTKNNEIFLEGKWRYAQSLDIGLVRFTTSEENGANSILNDSVNSVIRMIGKYSENDENLDKEITLEFSRKFSSKTTEKPFYILAHRGGGRNSDNLGASENTIEMINLAENLGANGIEIDVKLSKDNIPFLYHDVSLNLRTTTDSPIWGPVEDFTFSQLRSLIKLKNGEQIPSLEEALEFVLTETKLNVVWLDMKSEKNSMPFVVPIQQEFMERAKVLGRDVKIFIGLPDETMLQNFLQTPNFENIESLCELSIENMNKTKSIIWAPRWSLGLQNESVQNLHSQNKLAFTWTLDQAQFIYEFIDNGSFDGILTNYPTLVAYYYYVQE